VGSLAELLLLGFDVLRWLQARAGRRTSASGRPSTASDRSWARVEAEGCLDQLSEFQRRSNSAMGSWRDGSVAAKVV
jgi:hypothetical protein